MNPKLQLCVPVVLLTVPDNRAGTLESAFRRLMAAVMTQRNQPLFGLMINQLRAPQLTSLLSMHIV